MLVEVDPPRRLSPVQSSGNIGRDIRALRRSRNWTLNDLAEQLGRSVGWLSQVERDVTEPALEDIRKIAALFNLPVGFFLHHTGQSERAAPYCAGRVWPGDE